MPDSAPLPRQQTGIPRLDDLLGGGLLPGTLTVVLGATGIGKTQLGLQFAHAGLAQEGEPGVIFDLTGSYRAAFLNGIGWNLLNLTIALWLLRRSRGSGLGQKLEHSPG